MFKDTMNFGDGLRIQRRAVIAWRNEFALGAVEVAAPVRDHAIAALGSVTVSPIADDGVIGNAGRDRDFIDG